MTHTTDYSNLSLNLNIDEETASILGLVQNPTHSTAIRSAISHKYTELVQNIMVVEKIVAEKDKIVE